jgi:hypothetical protein
MEANVCLNSRDFNITPVSIYSTTGLEESDHGSSARGSRTISGLLVKLQYFIKTEWRRDQNEYKLYS